MVGGIDFGGAQQRHHDRLQEEFKRTTENDADGQTSKPAPWSHVADVAPWRMRSPGPQKHQKAAERFNDRRQDDDENREKSQRPESAQLRGDRIVRRRCGSRFERERRNVLGQIRDVACHGRALSGSYLCVAAHRRFGFKNNYKPELVSVVPRDALQ